MTRSEASGDFAPPGFRSWLKGASTNLRDRAVVEWRLEEQRLEPKGYKIFASIDQTLDFPTASLVCAHYGVTARKVD